MERNTYNYIAYVYETRLKIICGIAVLILVFSLLFLFGGYGDVQKAWKDHFDWMVTTATLLVALSVFFSEVREEWRESLPKKLTVSFVYQGAVVMKCENATLTGEADIRSLSQQIGRQIVTIIKKECEDANLKLKPMLDNFSRRLDYEQREMHYAVTINLRELPNCLMNVYKRKKLLMWVAPFNEELNEVDVF